MENAPLDELAALTRRSDEELLEILARALLGADVGAMPGPSRRERAARWVDRFVAEQRDELCSRPEVIAVLDEGYNELEEAAVIADALAAALGAKVPALATVAIILARRGLRAICQPAV